MKLAIAKCPTCGESAAGIYEECPGLALLTEPDENGAQEYAGETEMFWDCQEAPEDNDGVEVQCENHHHWKTKVDWEA